MVSVPDAFMKAVGCSDVSASGSIIIRMIDSHCLRIDIGIADVGNALGLVTMLQQGASQYAECVADCQPWTPGKSDLNNNHIDRVDHTGELLNFACALLNPFTTGGKFGSVMCTLLFLHTT